MKYDKIRGKSVAECMMKLRSAYGSSAIILSTREVSEGGLLGSGLFSRKCYEIDFMLQEDASSSLRPLLAGAGGRSSSERSALGRALLEAAGTRTANASTSSSPSSSSASDETRIARSNNESKTTATGIPPLPEKQQRAPTVPATPEELALERQALDMLLAEAESDDFSGPAPERGTGRAAPGPEAVRPSGAGRELAAPAMLEEPARQYAGESESRTVAGVDRAGAGDERFSRILHRIRGRLLSSQVSQDFAERFLLQVDHSLSRAERAEYRNVEERSLKQLAEMIRTVPDIAPRHGECQAVMLFGPTGSGKTTSLAKLAARYHIMQGREVSIYSLDHYRLAATEQLKTYAGVMDLPFFAPLSPRDFSEYLRRDGAELMLIDTSGIGYRDAARIEQLREYVDACEVRLEKHLVLAANTNAAMLEKILLAYDQIGFDKIILTKLDESDFLGAFIELADKYNRPFSFLMNGQDVPGSILEAESMDLARMVLSGPVGEGVAAGENTSNPSGI